MARRPRAWPRAALFLSLSPVLSSVLVTGATSPAGASTPVTASACTADRAAGTVRFATPFGYDASAGIIDVYAAVKLGYFKALCLNVQFVDAPLGESYALVSAGTDQFTGEGSAADALVAESNGDNFIAVATFGDTSDYVLLTRKSITNLRQLEGKVLAYHPPVLPVVLHEMLVKAGVDLKRVTFVSDTTYDALLLVHGSYDALQGYESNEPITLRADHEPFNMWTPSQFGISGTFNVQVVNRRFLAAHPAAVAAFLRAELKAFGYCVAHAATCVAYLSKASPPPFDTSHALDEWRTESTLAEDHHLPGQGIGVESEAEWAPEAQAVYRYGLVHKPIDLAVDEDTALAASLYHGATLTWP